MPLFDVVRRWPTPVLETAPSLLLLLVLGETEEGKILFEMRNSRLFLSLLCLVTEARSLLFPLQQMKPTQLPFPVYSTRGLLYAFLCSR